jgi:2-polyprenyl-3-methyl-5-hydroxy-6-metoxy-1,4-benzoquinol methylase
MHQSEPQSHDAQATREHWDNMAGDYDRAKRRNDAYYRTLKKCFDQAIPQAFRGRVLEVGCGTGQVLASLRPLHGVGVDVSHRMIEMARQQFDDRPELNFAVMDASKLMTETAGSAEDKGQSDNALRVAPQGADGRGLSEFDAVISADVMEHVDDWPAVVEMMVMSCRSGGLIAICTPNPRWAAALWVLEKVKLKMPEGPHHFVPIRAVAAALRERGCEIVQFGTHLILPVHLGGVGPKVSELCEHLPIIRGLGVIQLVVARKGTGG